MSDPTFVATFVDGEITRMTMHCANGKLDLARGVRLSRQAYRVRKGQCAAGHDRRTFRECGHMTRVAPA